MGVKEQEILENIIRLAELLDDEALKQLADLPFLELAKAVSFNRRETELDGALGKKSNRRKKLRAWDRR